MFHQRFQLSAVFKQPYIYVFGGRFFGANVSNRLANCERYNTKTKKWIMIGSLNIPRAQATAFIAKDKIYVAQGSQNNEFLEYYDEKTNKWNFT